jgi:hypothetical protein
VLNDDGASRPSHRIAFDGGPAASTQIAGEEPVAWPLDHAIAHHDTLRPERPEAIAAGPDGQMLEDHASRPGVLGSRVSSDDRSVVNSHSGVRPRERGHPNRRYRRDSVDGETVQVEVDVASAGEVDIDGPTGGGGEIGGQDVPARRVDDER